MANDQMYKIVGMPKSSELEAEVLTSVKSKEQLRNNLIFTKRCLLPIKVDE